MLEQIKIDKSPGPDQIHPKLLKSLASDPKFVDSVYKLFICCAESRQIPSDWKLANLIALHKKGPRNRAENYRPVSLTSILCKLYYLFCSYRQRPLTVKLKMEYSIIPLVHLSLELQPLLQLASSDVNLTCGVINKFSIRSFNSWVPLGLGLWLK